MELVDFNVTCCVGSTKILKITFDKAFLEIGYKLAWNLDGNVLKNSSEFYLKNNDRVDELFIPMKFGLHQKSNKCVLAISSVDGNDVCHTFLLESSDPTDTSDPTDNLMLTGLAKLLTFDEAIEQTWSINSGPKELKSNLSKSENVTATIKRKWKH
uniref:Uncharacterized protein n=1 Tax=viral metagenome TaxID=1070528 RepID=A0A6C0E0Q0_9ZZZZ